MSDTKEKIVATADQLLRTKGYNAFSYKDISAPLSIKNAAIHYHFPAKADLGIAVVEREISIFSAKAAIWASLPEDEQIAQLFVVFERYNRQGNICLVASLASDFKTLEPAMQEKVQEMSDNVLTWLTNCLNAGRSKGILKFPGEPFTRALLIITNLQSSLLMTRIKGQAIFRQITAQLLDDLRS